MAIERVVFLRNKKSQAGVLESFREWLDEALDHLGVITTTFDFDDYESGKAIPQIVSCAPDCTIGFNILLPQDSPLGQFHIPHYAPLCDCATYYPELRLSNHMLASFMDEDSFGFLKLLGVQNIFYLPHAISGSLLSKKATKRDLDVVMAGSFVNPNAIRKVWDEQLSPKVRDCMLELAEAVLASPNLSHLQAFFELIEEKGSFEKELMSKRLDFYSQLNMLEVYIRNTDRLRYVQNIRNHTVHIFCAKVFQNNWQKALEGQSNVQFHDEVPFKELPGVFSRARAVINCIPTIKRGLHERFLLALAQGASVLGSENIYIAGQFYQPKACLNLLSPNYKEADAMLEEAFRSEEERLQEVFSTHEIIQQKHTWDVRAKTILETLPAFIEKL
jgi:hypothetical protein